MDRVLGLWAASGGDPAASALHNGVGEDGQFVGVCIGCGQSVLHSAYATHRTAKNCAGLRSGAGGGAGASGGPGERVGRSVPQPPPPPPGTSVERVYSFLTHELRNVYRTSLSGLRGSYLLGLCKAYVQSVFSMPASVVDQALFGKLDEMPPLLAGRLSERDTHGWPLQKIRDLVWAACSPCLVRGRWKSASTVSWSDEQLSVAVKASLALRSHMQHAFDVAVGLLAAQALTSGGGPAKASGIGYSRPILLPAAAWTQPTVPLTAACATELVIIGKALTLWKSVAGPRQGSATPTHSSRAAWIGCVFEARRLLQRTALGHHAPASEALAEEEDVQGDLLDTSGARQAWIRDLLAWDTDPVLADLFRRFGPPCGLSVNGGSLFLRFHRTVLSRGRSGGEEEEEEEAETEEGEEADVCTHPCDESDTMPHVDFKYHRWSSAPPTPSVHSLYDPALSTDTAAFELGEEGFYSLYGVPRHWKAGATRVTYLDLGQLLLAAGETTARPDEGLSLSRKVTGCVTPAPPPPLAWSLIGFPSCMCAS